MPELLCRPSDPEWHELRRTGVTATDITVIAGLVSWDSPWALFWRKRGVLPPVTETYRMRRGSWLEEMLAQEWHSQHLFHDLSPGGLYASSDRPWQMATLDRLADGEPVECKSTEVRDGWGPSGTDEVPARVRAQLLQQMDVLGASRGHVAADVCGEFRSYTIEHPDGCIGRAFDPAGDDPRLLCGICHDIEGLRESGLEFYRRLTGELPPPDVDGSVVTTAGLKARYASPGANLRAELPPALISAWEEDRLNLAGARAQVRAYEEYARRSENKLREALANAVVGTVNGRPVIERKFSKRAGYTVDPAELDQLKTIKGDGDE